MTSGWRYVCGSTRPNETFTYDEVGNRTSQSGSYGDGNRITALGNFTFEHDADGNITRRQNSATGQDRRYYWSAENLLDSVVTVGGDRVHYQYNAFGQPVVRKRNGSVERYFLYDRGHLLAELDASFNRVAEYVYVGVDQPLAMLTGSTSATGMEFFQQDELGNVIGRHSGGSVVESTIYGTWGTSAQTMLGWKGLRWEGDGVDLYHMRARWYDPQIGRFISEDPIGLAGGINQYTFAGNDLINGFDPTGLSHCVTFDFQIPYHMPDGGVVIVGYTGRYCPDHYVGFRDRSEIHSFSQFVQDRPTGFRALAGDELEVEGANLPPLQTHGFYQPGIEPAPLDPLEILTGAVVVRRACIGLKALGNAAFGRGGFLNSNRYLRIGYGRHDGVVFRIAGEWIEKLPSSLHRRGHIDLWCSSRLQP